MAGTGGASQEGAAWVAAEMQRVYPEMRASIMAEVHAAMQSGAQVPIAPFVASKGPDLRPSKPSKFRGDKVDLEEVTVWLFGLESYFDITQVCGDSVRVAFAAAMLEGPAQSWWMTIKRSGADGDGNLTQIVPKTWMEFSLALTQRFQPINADRAARDRLLKLCQSPSVGQFASTFQQLLLKCPDIGVKDQIHRFISGLKPHIQRVVLLQKPVDLVEAISMAELVDNVAFHSTVRSGNGGGATAMDLGAMEEGDLAEAEAEEEGRGMRMESLQMQLAALQRVEPNGPSQYAGQGRALQGSMGQRNNGRTWPSSRPTLSSQELADRRNECNKGGLCFRCMRPGHLKSECREEWRSNVNVGRE